MSNVAEFTRPLRLFTVTCAGYPLCVVRAGERAAAIGIVSRMLEAGPAPGSEDGRTQGVPLTKMVDRLAARNATEAEKHAFAIRCGRLPPAMVCAAPL